MFRQRFLQWSTHKALKRNSYPRASIPFSQAVRLGVLFTVEDKEKHDRVKNFVRQLEHQGKQVTVLEYLPEKRENYEFLYDFFSIQDLGFWGSLHSDKANEFMRQPFDYLFCLDTQPHHLIRHILAKSRAHCRVGNYSQEGTEYFEFMIASQNQLARLVDGMLQYTAGIR